MGKLFLPADLDLIVDGGSENNNFSNQKFHQKLSGNQFTKK